MFHLIISNNYFLILEQVDGQFNSNLNRFCQKHKTNTYRLLLILFFFNVLLMLSLIFSPNCYIVFMKYILFILQVLESPFQSNICTCNQLPLSLHYLFFHFFNFILKTFFVWCIHSSYTYFMLLLTYGANLIYLRGGGVWSSDYYPLFGSSNSPPPTFPTITNTSVSKFCPTIW